MSIDEVLDVIRIYSVADQLPSETPLPLLTALAPHNGDIPFTLHPVGTARVLRVDEYGNSWAAPTVTL